MKHNIYLMSVMLLIILPITLATHTVKYPYFMDVNVSERITIVDETPDINQSHYLSLEGVMVNMSRLNANTFYLDVTNTDEDGIPFILFAIDNNISIINNSNGTQTSQVPITDSSIYVFNYTEINTHVIGQTEEHIVCAKLQSTTSVNRNLYFLVGINGSSSITWWSSSAILYKTLTYQYVCGDILQTYPATISNFTKYFGFYCSDCSSTKGLNLALDIHNVSNTSLKYSNLTDNTADVNSNGNYIIYSSDLEGSPEIIYNGIFRFRIPYNLTFRFYKKDTNYSSGIYNNEFQYVILQKYNASFNPIKDLSYLDKMFGWVPFYKSSFVKTDTDLSHWAKYNSDGTIIKLYEKGNYSIKILSTDVTGLTWSEEFIYPQVSTYEWLSTIKGSLLIDNEVNQNVNVYVSMWELSKFDVLMNFFWYTIAFSIWLLVVILILSSVNSNALSVIWWTLGWITICKILGFIWGVLF